jgi:hypothetical protein
MAHRKAFPDWNEEVEDEIMNHDRVAVRFTSRGTNTGDFLGNPPTGNQVEISEVAIFRLLDGKIVEQWVYPDMLSLQRQLNAQNRHPFSSSSVLPEPARPRRRGGWPAPLISSAGADSSTPAPPDQELLSARAG